jgi:hypothetical protein
MDPITTANPIGDDGPEAGISVGHYMNTGGEMGRWGVTSLCERHTL